MEFGHAYIKARLDFHSNNEYLLKYYVRLILWATRDSLFMKINNNYKFLLTKPTLSYHTLVSHTKNQTIFSK